MSARRLAEGEPVPIACPLPLDIIQMQPKPVGLIVVHQPEHNQTVIVMNWRDGDPARCRLCAQCSANPCNTCARIVPGLISPESASLFRSPR